jgi:hypothetical protein
MSNLFPLKTHKTVGAEQVPAAGTLARAMGGICFGPPQGPPQGNNSLFFILLLLFLLLLLAGEDVGLARPPGHRLGLPTVAALLPAWF